jgi:hypothetical protein
MEKTKHTLVSRHQNAGQHRDIKIAREFLINLIILQISYATSYERKNFRITAFLDFVHRP